MISFSFQSFARGWLGEKGSSMQEVRAGSGQRSVPWGHRES